jgi:hypothetical protein
MRIYRFKVGLFFLLFFSPLYGGEEEFLVGKVEILLLKGEYRKALSLIEEGLEKFPEEPRFKLYGGISYLLVGEYEKAIRSLEEVVPLYPKVSVLLAFAYLEAGREEDTGRVLQGVEGGEMKEILLAYLTLRRNPQEGVVLFNRLIRKRKDLAPYLLFLRGIYQYRVDREGAGKAWEASKVLYPTPEGRFFSRWAWEMAQGGGEKERAFSGGILLDSAYDTNYTRVAIGEKGKGGFRGFLKGRGEYRPSLLPFTPYLGVLFQYDLPYPPPEGGTQPTGSMVAVAVDGSYQLPDQTVFGITLEPLFVMDRFFPYSLEVRIRPHFTPFLSLNDYHRFFYEISFIQGFSQAKAIVSERDTFVQMEEQRRGQELKRGLEHTVGYRYFRVLYPGGTFYSTLLSFHYFSSPFPGMRSYGPAVVLQGRWVPETVWGFYGDGEVEGSLSFFSDRREGFFAGLLSVGSFLFKPAFLSVGVRGEGGVRPVDPYRTFLIFLRIGGEWG